VHFHRLFFLGRYESLAIVLISVLYPTAAAHFQLVASTAPLGWNSWNHFSDKVRDSDVRATADVGRAGSGAP
jgi:alpha-galactosidase